jgi:hypothetical protein
VSPRLSLLTPCLPALKIRLSELLLSFWRDSLILFYVFPAGDSFETLNSLVLLGETKLWGTKAVKFSNSAASWAILAYEGSSLSREEYSELEDFLDPMPLILLPAPFNFFSL